MVPGPIQVLQSLVVLALAPPYAGVLIRAEAIVASKRGPSVLRPYRTWPSCAARAARSATRFPGCFDVFPHPTRMRPRLVPAELLRRTGKHTGTAAGHAGRSVLSPARRAGAHRRDRPPSARLPSDRAGHPAGRTTRRTAPGHGQARPAAMAPGPRSDPYDPGRPRRPRARGGSGTELDGVFAPLRQPPPTSATRRSSHEPPPGTSARQPPPGSPWPD